jgi:hypothetical protein
MRMLRITRLLRVRSWRTSLPRTPHVGRTVGQANVQNTDNYYNFFFRAYTVLLTEGSDLGSL